MRLPGALLFSLLLLMLTATAAEPKTPRILAIKDGNSTDHPSGAKLAGCQTSCGNRTFDYPFGIGSADCFRGPDFNLTCDNTAQPPRLYLRDASAEVIHDIDVTTDGYETDFLYMHIPIVITLAVAVRPGINEYTMPWKAPGRAFTLEYAMLNITGCDFDTYLLGQDTNEAVKLCTVTCPDAEITEKVARENCNGTGCCSIRFETYLRAFEFRFVLHNKGELDSNRSSIWKSINVTSDYAAVSWSIVDQSTCARTLDNRTKYACVSNHSKCYDSYLTADLGYLCGCKGGYMGNPYIANGCSRDKGYNPYEQRDNCRRTCGNISVPYPFGLEEGCYARKLFELNCTNATSSTLQFNDDRYQVTKIDISEGLVEIKYSSYFEQLEFRPYVAKEPELYIGWGDSSSARWAVANLSCEEAKMNQSGYACVSINSTCLGVNSTDRYIGYRCKCMPGFDGNPYVHDGCKDIDECLVTPGICKGVCQNTIGGYNCSRCPEKTEYDPTVGCTKIKKQNLIPGIVIGLGCGLGILLFSLSTTLLYRKWKRNIQNKLRRRYFQKNQGLLLEQIILSDENANDNTKIFTLEELEKATNNFDPTRILGRGGHGMVYKGILSDQRVVAIKRSKDIEEGEISQFINEVAILSQINHRNIVKLFGCCLETEVPLLVYDFIPNGSLFDVLHSCSDSSISLTWDECLRIATETAGALYYLHSAASVSVFHRDVKSSNILLDSNYTAKVSDFGASRVVPIDQTHVVTNVQGTFGYLDPEYYHTGQLNEKSDVYSFGVVLAELLLRRKPIFTDETGSVTNLSNFFLGELKLRQIKDIVAAQVCKEATEEEINSFATLAEMCLRLQSEARPTMKQVEMTLQFLRTKRTKSCVIPVEGDEEMQPLLSIGSGARFESSARNMSADMGADSVPSYGQEGFISFELECASSFVGKTH